MALVTMNVATSVLDALEASDAALANVNASPTALLGTLTDGSTLYFGGSFSTDVASSFINFVQVSSSSGQVLFTIQNFTVSVSDLLNAAAPDELVFSGNDTVYGSTQNDDLTGYSGNDSIVGGAGDDTISGSRGGDAIEGGDGNDIIYGGKDYDYIQGGAGADTMNGNIGNDYVIGGAGNDVLHGGKDNDSLSADEGNDSIYGDIGDDYMYGDAGADTFFFLANSGRDTIADFENGVDKIALSAQGIHSFADVASRISTSTLMGGSTVIALDANNVITLSGTASSLIDASDFIFV